MALNPKAEPLLRKCIKMGQEGNPRSFSDWQEQSRTALRIAFGEDDPIIARFDDIGYSPTIFSTASPQSLFDDTRRAGVRRGIALLNAALIEVQVAEPEEVSVNVGSLHKWFAATANSLWEAGLPQAHRDCASHSSRLAPTTGRTPMTVLAPSDGVASCAFATWSFMVWNSKSTRRLSHSQHSAFSPAGSSPQSSWPPTGPSNRQAIT